MVPQPERPPNLNLLVPVTAFPPFSLTAAEDELRASGVPFAIVRPTALTEEAGGMPLVVEQGDTLKGKVSREVRCSTREGALVSRTWPAADSCCCGMRLAVWRLAGT